jgi:hypothetical protein
MMDKGKVCNLLSMFSIIIFGGLMNSSSNTFNVAYSKAVDLIELNSGNSTLDKNLPLFYDCIDEAVDSSKNTEEDPYFKDEPTKNEVVSCYYQTFPNE